MYVYYLLIILTFNTKFVSPAKPSLLMKKTCHPPHRGRFRRKRAAVVPPVVLLSGKIYSRLSLSNTKKEVLEPHLI